MPQESNFQGFGINRQRSQPFEFREDRELGRAQASRRQELIVNLGDVPCRRADGEAIAFLGIATLSILEKVHNPSCRSSYAHRN